MRFPRVQFTIGRLMIVVLVAGLAFWELVLPWITPADRELAALADYKQASLTREVAEYALKEYEQGVFKQDQATVMAEFTLLGFPDRFKTFQRENRDRTIKSIQSDIAKAQADETSKRATFRLERARHWGVYAWW